jgi:hypothetical protein
MSSGKYWKALVKLQLFVFLLIFIIPFLPGYNTLLKLDFLNICFLFFIFLKNNIKIFSIFNIMDIFSNLKEYELLELQQDFQTILMIKKNNNSRYIGNEELEEIKNEIKYYKSLFKNISNELENIDL